MIACMVSSVLACNGVDKLKAWRAAGEAIYSSGPVFHPCAPSDQLHQRLAVACCAKRARLAIEVGTVGIKNIVIGAALDAPALILESVGA